MTERFVCEAREYGGLHYCGRCQLAGVSEPVCKTPAETGLTLPVMREAALAEASRIDDAVDLAVAMAERMVLSGMQTTPAPDPVLLRRSAALRAVARLVDRLKGDQVIIDRLRSRDDR
jgi:hypothetical protein